ncbi:MAG: RNase adapter RapZ [Nitrospiraceae bacterium]|nr:MAG: RNase adapter RapZ [Nitrospiraceae bacterium]
MSRQTRNTLHAIILTGLSGAGKSVALHAFEDGGFFCVDNLPLMLMETFVSLGDRTPTISKIAIGIDIRDKKFLTHFSGVLSALRKNCRVEVIFLEAQDDVLIRRFKETRRPHPLGQRDLRSSIVKEMRLLRSIRQQADIIVDTSTLTPHRLRKFITDAYIRKGSKKMTVSLISFGYKYGIPPEADLLFDVRFLPNPYFIEKLKPYPGTSAKVKNFVLSQESTREFLTRLDPVLNYIIPLYAQEGRNYLTIGVGCTGGRHRSPAIALEMEKRFKKLKLTTTVTHRDLENESA